jgi:hypothetical protein
MNVRSPPFGIKDWLLYREKEQVLKKDIIFRDLSEKSKEYHRYFSMQG